MSALVRLTPDNYQIPDVAILRFQAISGTAERTGSAANVRDGGSVFCNDFNIAVDQAIALSVGFIEASSPLTSAAGLGGLNR